MSKDLQEKEKGDQKVAHCEWNVNIERSTESFFSNFIDFLRSYKIFEMTANFAFYSY
jgi:hypothetical protein